MLPVYTAVVIEGISYSGIGLNPLTVVDPGTDDIPKAEANLSTELLILS
jgi:hypothetical protein